ncbi:MULTISPECIES: hypothetical protein [Bacillus]|uniref:DUF2178 domain-containing protein n=1 Tax=Bacillus bingmayongensis TaxID=1150157 RepID=A0ABU5JWK4_9BACI|nr:MULTISPECIES: hypothetical protein [Bacillus]MBO1579833.1 DUF2178 domain-containing protein [Bacillus sp. XF8]MBY0595055.1 DUF2178 domain-containing protein [Bacillus bingmayongensis]MDZ5607567.1 DUF2178 domain-containing protein [Bacillus pseudomycoides]
MNRVVLSYVMSVVCTCLAAWAFIELFYAYMDFANIISTKPEGFEIAIDATPVFGLVSMAVIFFIIYRIQKKKYKKLSFWMFPLLFPQDDEREEIITAKACRTTFVALWYVIPIAAGLLILSPIVNSYVPAYPLYIVFLILFIQVTVFHISLYRNKIA